MQKKRRQISSGAVFDEPKKGYTKLIDIFFKYRSKIDGLLTKVLTRVQCKPIWGKMKRDNSFKFLLV